MKNALQWRAACSHVCSSSFWSACAAALGESLPVCIVSAVGMALVWFVAVQHIPGISLFFRQLLHIKAPLLAMASAPLYTPFLIKAVARVTGKAVVTWWKTVAWSCAMYALMALLLTAFYFLCIEGSIEMLLGFLCAVMISLPFLAPYIAAFPVASVAVVFEPFSKKSTRQVWRHARKMTWGELPAILIVMCLCMPLSHAYYAAALFLYRAQYLSLESSYGLLHVLSVVCWQIGWIFFMVFYQQRKSAYFE